MILGSNYDSKEYCATPECLAAGKFQIEIFSSIFFRSTESSFIATALLDSMNPKVDPCHDFFQYACGGWIAKNKIPKSESRLIQMDLVMQQLSSKILSIQLFRFIKCLSSSNKEYISDLERSRRS